MGSRNREEEFRPRKVAFSVRKVCRDATEAAVIGLPLEETLDDYTTKTIGLKPKTFPKPEEPDTTEEEQRLRAAEDELTKHPDSKFLLTMLVCLFVVEAIACVLLMGSLGYENPARLVFGFMCAAIIFVLTYSIANINRKHSAAAVRAPSGATATPTQQPRRLRAALYCTYAAMIVAMSVLRLDEMEGSDDSSLVYELSAAVVLTGLTMGIAWLAELIMQRLIPMIPTLRERALQRRRIAVAGRQHAQHIAVYEHALADAQAWEDVVKRLQAEYSNRYLLVERATHGAQHTGAHGGNGAMGNPTRQRRTARNGATP